MAAPPIGARGESLPPASTPANSADTSRYRAHSHGRDRWTRPARAVRHTLRRGTSSTTSIEQSDDENHEDAGWDYWRDAADQFAGPLHRMFHEPHGHPIACRGWT